MANTARETKTEIGIDMPALFRDYDETLSILTDDGFKEMIGIDPNTEIVNYNNEHTYGGDIELEISVLEEYRDKLYEKEGIIEINASHYNLKDIYEDIVEVLENREFKDSSYIHIEYNWG